MPAGIHKAVNATSGKECRWLKNPLADDCHASITRLTAMNAGTKNAWYALLSRFHRNRPSPITNAGTK